MIAKSVERSMGDDPVIPSFQVMETKLVCLIPEI